MVPVTVPVTDFAALRFSLATDGCLPATGFTGKSAIIRLYWDSTDTA